MSIEFEEHPSAAEQAYEEPRRLGGTDVLRGAMVVGTAVLVGAVLLISGIGGDDESALTSATAAEQIAEEAAVGATDSVGDGTSLADGQVVPGGGQVVEQGDGTMFDPIGDPIGDGLGDGLGLGDGVGDGLGLGSADPGSTDPGSATAPDSFGQPTLGAQPDVDADELPPGLTGGSGSGLGGSEVLPSEDTSAGVTGAATSSEAAVRLPAEVKVLILNGIGAQGIAARGTAAVEAAGYETGTPKNAEPSPQLSGIYYVDGYRREALDVAQVYSDGLDELVKPLTADNAPVADTQSADVIVVIGSDRAIPLP